MTHFGMYQSLIWQSPFHPRAGSLDIDQARWHAYLHSCPGLFPKTYVFPVLRILLAALWHRACTGARWQARWFCVCGRGLCFRLSPFFIVTTALLELLSEKLSKVTVHGSSCCTSAWDSLSSSLYICLIRCLEGFIAWSRSDADIYQQRISPKITTVI